MIGQTSMKFMAWVCNYIRIKLRRIITYPHSNYNGQVSWIIRFHRKLWMQANEISSQAVLCFQMTAVDGTRIDFQWSMDDGKVITRTKKWDVITQPCISINGGVAKPPLKLCHGRVISFRRELPMQLLIHVPSQWFILKNASNADYRETSLHAVLCF